MKKELKSGITEVDNLVEKFENGEISFVELTSSLWNKGYAAGSEEANGADTSNYKALPIQSVSGSAFGIAISDGFVTYEYPLRIENNSIQKVYWKICEAFGVKPEDGRILRHYR